MRERLRLRSRRGNILNCRRLNHDPILCNLFILCIVPTDLPALARSRLRRRVLIQVVRDKVLFWEASWYGCRFAIWRCPCKTLFRLPETVFFDWIGVGFEVGVKCVGLTTTGMEASEYRTSPLPNLAQDCLSPAIRSRTVPSHCSTVSLPAIGG